MLVPAFHPPFFLNILIDNDPSRLNVVHCTSSVHQLQVQTIADAALVFPFQFMLCNFTEQAIFRRLFLFLTTYPTLPSLTPRGGEIQASFPSNRKENTSGTDKTS